MIANSRLTNPNARAPAPAQSVGIPGRRCEPGTTATTATNASTIKIPVITNNHCQLRYSRMTPPITSALPAPIPKVPASQPIPEDNSGPTTVLRSTAIASGKLAMLTPWTARTTSSTPIFGAAAAANVARAKMIRTITRTRLSPNRSPIAPTIGAITAAANRYAVRIQPVTATDVSKCSPNTGNAGTSMVCMSE